jgi:hypothetical protein
MLTRMRWNAASQNWSDGLSDPLVISPLVRSGSDTGYTLKSQLGSRPVEDASRDLVYFGFASWKDDSAGDTWSFAAVDAAHDDQVAQLVDVYSAGGAHSYAPGGDLAFDDASGLLVVAHITTGAQAAIVRLYDRGQVRQEIEAFRQAPVDLPLLASQTRVGAPARLLMVFRDTINTPDPPYHGWAGALLWE